MKVEFPRECAGSRSERQRVKPAFESAAFTLVEILVVLAIILVLSAMLFPAVKSAVEKSKRAKCLNNMRQVGIALYSYANDHQGRFLIPATPVFTSGGSFPGSLYPPPFDQGLSNYVQKTDVLYCPSALNKTFINPITSLPFVNQVQPWGQLSNSITHYGYQLYLTPDMDSDIVLMWENTVNVGRYFKSYDLDVDYNGELYGEYERGRTFGKGLVQVSDDGYSYTANHGKLGGNVLYCDGHVQWNAGPYVGIGKKISMVRGGLDPAQDIYLFWD